MKRILLIDGHNLLFRMFFGMPFPFYDENQREITGTVGFVGSVVKMINYLNATHCLVVFDGQNSLTRKEDDQNYKANRTLDYGQLPDNQNPFTQLDFIKATLDYLKIGWVETQNCECDDYIAQICKENNDQIFISSTDSDFLQLVNNNVNVVNYRGKKTVVWNNQLVSEKYGISPSEFALYKAMVGDKSDNIAGISGVGPKSAVHIINSLNNNTSDKYLQIYIDNQALVGHNLNLIVLPKSGVVVQPVDNCQVNSDLIKSYKPLQTINKAINS